MPRLETLLSAETIAARVRELAECIDRDHPDGPVYLIGILKGSFVFIADLARAMKTPARIDFMGISSYGQGKTSSGQVKVTKDIDVPLEDRQVVVVEDIIDSGVTIRYLLKAIANRKPRSLKIAALLDKPERRITDVKVDYVGFAIPDKFVVGYGLDAGEDYRNLPDVCELKD